MSRAAEVLGVKPPMASDLAEGVKALSAVQTITFRRYTRHVLPLDGYVFWVKDSPEVLLQVQGSLHFGTVNTQDEAANISTSRVTLTALSRVNDLSEVNPSKMWIADLAAGETGNAGARVAFSMQGNFYRQADLYHYVGNALYADMQTQIIDDVVDLPSSLIVSNSLPIWLYLSLYTPQNPTYGFSNPFTLFPSFLVPDDISPVPPYGAVHIGDGDTEALMSAPILDQNQSSFQLVRDRVTVTLYGGNNKQALDFLNCLRQYSLDYETLGLLNMPVVQDTKRTQAEFSTLAMKKVVEIDVSYYQVQVEAVARQLITKSVPNYIFNT